MTTHGYLIRRPGRANTIVNAIQPAPGLYLYQDQPYRRCGIDYHWHIGHHSGLLIASAESAIVARQVIDEIANFIDWTRSAEAIKADTSIDVSDLRERIIYRTDGVFHQSRPAAA
ncbi:hypothetical protein [Streptomyces sp. NPDC001389]|uniref:hypothetical protein n=1 Tax=Streptomyces sp. NPDC001389 TaxID=3364569 RepID=UPI0036CA50F0